LPALRTVLPLARRLISTQFVSPRAAEAQSFSLRAANICFSPRCTGTSARPSPVTLLSSRMGSEPIGPNALDVLVNSLRTKFDAPYGRKSILTIRGVGYSLQSESYAPAFPRPFISLGEQIS
jgi:hypothetical protein